jgi:hypothetical protein
MNLGELITILSKQDQKLIMPLGFAMAHSYRGLYEYLAFEPNLDVSIGFMLGVAKNAEGKVFTAYKGGEYQISKETPCYLSPRDMATETEITESLLLSLVALAEKRRQESASAPLLSLSPSAPSPVASPPDPWRGLTQACDEVVERKGRDYTKGSSDRLANFREAGDEAGITPLQAWVVFFNKHIAAIKNYIKTGGQSESEPIMGRFVDAINYLRLGWLLVLDMQEAQKLGGSEAQKLNYVMGVGRYQEAPGVSLSSDGGSGRKFELLGRAATSALVFYDGMDRSKTGWAFGISWFGEQLRAGRAFPIDGTPE